MSSLPPVEDVLALSKKKRYKGHFFEISSLINLGVFLSQQRYHS